MGENSGIQWTTHTFNPWWGCQRVSPGCEHCYAEALDKRVGGGVDPADGVKKLRWGPKAPRVRTSAANWKLPLKWNKAAAKAGERHRVFCSSMADVFEDRPELEKWRIELFALISFTPNLDWLLLTKRPENLKRMLPAKNLQPWSAELWPNVWLGTTVEDQQRANERIPELLKVPAAVRFLSCEPLLEHVDITPWLGDLWECTTCGFDWKEAKALAGPSVRYCGMCAGDNGRDVEIRKMGPGINWVIIGGESGGGARPFHTGWARELVQQCYRAGAKPFVKQLGAKPIITTPGDRLGEWKDVPLRLSDGHGGDMAEWPVGLDDLKVREFPEVRR